LFGRDDFTRLRDVLSGLKARWLVSINNVPEIRQLFADFNIREVKTSYSINSSKNIPVTELLITNYK